MKIIMINDKTMYMLLKIRQKFFTETDCFIFIDILLYIVHILFFSL